MNINEEMDNIRSNDFMNAVPFIGVVEDNLDPMTLGRVKVRCFNFHPEDPTLVPTEALPWAIVLQPTTSAAISGIGDSPNGLLKGSWVYGFFADGLDAQKPFVTHSIPGIHRPSSDGEIGGTSSGYLDGGDYFAGDDESASSANSVPLERGNYRSGDGYDSRRPFHNEVVEGSDPSSGPVLAGSNNSAEQGEGALTAVGDINMYLQKKDKARFKELGLVTYSGDAAPNGYACKDGQGSLRFHYGTALAFEKLTKDYGKGKMYITSAYRTPAYNRRVGGAGRSQHTQGRALDVALSTIGSGQANIKRFAQLAVKCGFVGFGLYNSFLHIDTGSGRTWNGAKAGWFVNAIKEAGWYPGKKGLSDIQVSTGTSGEEGTATEPSQNADGSTNINVKGDSQQRVYNALKAKGYNDIQIAGIMGNFQSESNFRAGILNPNDKGKPSYGLAQWRDDRMRALFRHAGTQNPTIEQQIDFMDYELKNTHKAAMRGLESASTPAEAAYAFGSKFEVHEGSRDPNSSNSRARQNQAEQFYSGNGGTGNAQKGFVDPTNSLPTPEYRGEPSTNMAARGFNSYGNQQRIIARDEGRMTGFPAAGDIGTFGEPELAAAPQYPYNQVKSTISGHMIEMDDTPGSERVNIEHKSGSGVEIFADGRTVYRSKGNSYDMDGGDSYHAIAGKHFVTSVNDMNIRSTADLNMQSDGATNIIIGNDNTVLISGDYTLAVGDEIRILGGKINIEGASIDILSNSSLNIESKGDMTFKGANITIEATGSLGIKSGDSTNIDSGGDMGLKAPTVALDDVVRMAEGKAPSVSGSPGADTADLGSPPARKTIQKDNLRTTTNKNGIVTTEDAAEFYSQSI